MFSQMHPGATCVRIARFPILLRMKLALFDFDGTLTTQDTFAPFLRHAVPPMRRVLGGAVLSPLLPLYRRGWLTSAVMRRVAAQVALSGLDESRMREAGGRYAREVVPRMLRPEAMAALRAHRDAGDRVIVVSAAFELYVAPWCASEGVECLASRLEVREGRFTGRYLGAQCAGAEKVKRVRAFCDVSGFSTIHAWGDTPEDDALLALAARRFYRGEDVSAHVWPPARR